MLFFLFCSSVFCSEELQPVTPREQAGQMKRISPPPSPPQLPERSQLRASFLALTKSERVKVLARLEVIYEHAKQCNQEIQSRLERRLAELVRLCSAQQRQLQQLQLQQV